MTEQVSNFEILDQVSTGQTGAVFRARNTALDRKVLMKILPTSAVGNEKLRKRFQREIRLAAQLTHPNLIIAYHAGQQDGRHYLVMEDVDGVDLATRIKEKGPLPIEDAVDYLAQASRGLAYMHDQGIFHRNVKPANLMVGRRGQIKVTNLTMALVDEDAEIDTGDLNKLTAQGQILGTAEYMAPEQSLDAHSADARSDIYSLGCTLYYLLTGKPPYIAKGTTSKLAAHAQQPIPSLRDERKDVSLALDKVFAKMVAKVPEDRYQSMEEFEDELMRAFYGGSTTVSRPGRFSWELLVTGILIGGGMAALAAIMLSMFD